MKTLFAIAVLMAAVPWVSAWTPPAGPARASAAATQETGDSPATVTHETGATGAAPAPMIPVDSMPLPPPNPKQLFYLQRTPNRNTIICEINEKNGVLDAGEPVHVSWLRYTENQQGARAELSYIQRTFAYGMKFRRLAPEKYEMHFVSYKSFSMYLVKAADRQYHVFAEINGRMVILRRIFVSIKGGTFWKPHVEYVELKGADPTTGREVLGKIQI
jgi:hypothetical protein